MVGFIIAMIVMIVIAVSVIIVQDFCGWSNKDSTPSQPTHPAASASRSACPAVSRRPISECSETGPMIYFADDRYGRKDREYRFNYKRVYDDQFNAYSWRAYILRMPSLCGRNDDGRITHRWSDGNGNFWVCWDRAVNSLEEMQTISRVWANSIQEYIATGKRFG